MANAVTAVRHPPERATRRSSTARYWRNGWWRTVSGFVTTLNKTKRYVENSTYKRWRRRKADSARSGQKEDSGKDKCKDGYIGCWRWRYRGTPEAIYGAWNKLSDLFLVGNEFARLRLVWFTLFRHLFTMEAVGFIFYRFLFGIIEKERIFAALHIIQRADGSLLLIRQAFFMLVDCCNIAAV